MKSQRKIIRSLGGSLALVALLVFAQRVNSQ